MRTRTALTAGLVAVLAVGSFAPAFAAKPKPKPKPIAIGYTASAMPDPTSTNQATGEQCVPVTPTGIHKHSFKVPAAGTLEIALNNTLDWSVAIRAADGETLASADGGTPETSEAVSVRFKKAQTISIDACNWAGEPSIGVTGTFTYK